MTEINQNNTQTAEETEVNEEDLDEVTYINKVGELVFESALLRFVTEVNDEVANEFETFVKLHLANEDFVELLTNKYPRFAVLLAEEAAVLEAEAEKMFG